MIATTKWAMPTNYSAMAKQIKKEQGIANIQPIERGPSVERYLGTKSSAIAILTALNNRGRTFDSASSRRLRDWPWLTAQGTFQPAAISNTRPYRDLSAIYDLCPSRDLFAIMQHLLLVLLLQLLNYGGFWTVAFAITNNGWNPKNWSEADKYWCWLLLISPVTYCRPDIVGFTELQGAEITGCIPLPFWSLQNLPAIGYKLATGLFPISPALGFPEDYRRFGLVFSFSVALSCYQVLFIWK